MQPLIDADILLYEIGFACQQKVADGVILKPVEEVNELMDTRIKEICAAVYATESPMLFITGKGNFRHAAATSREYKGNRKQLKPFYYYYLKKYLQAQWNAIIVDGMEADDALCIEQTKRLAHRDTIICSRDKDLKQCPVYHYTW
jgi:isopentenyl phosphate kinase